MARTKGGRKRERTNLQNRQKFHDENLEKKNSDDGNKAYTRPGSNKK